MPFADTPILAPHATSHKKQQPHCPNRDMKFPVAIKPKRCQHSHKQPSQCAASGNAEKILREPCRLRPQAIQFAMAYHTAYEKRAAVEAHLR